MEETSESTQAEAAVRWAVVLEDIQSTEVMMGLKLVVELL